MEEKNKKWIKVAVIILVIILISAGCINYMMNKEKGVEKNNNTASTTEEKKKETETETPKKEENKTDGKEKYELDKPFKFDDLEITIGSKYDFKQINNKYTEENGKYAIEFPITVKNLKNDTHFLNTFFISMFGSQGTKLKTVASYFLKDAIDFNSKLREGASTSKKLYVLYDGDGKYTLEFTKGKETGRIDIDIKKGQ